jgi:hypothetical protein
MNGGPENSGRRPTALGSNDVAGLFITAACAVNVTTSYLDSQIVLRLYIHGIL